MRIVAFRAASSAVVGVLSIVCATSLTLAACSSDGTAAADGGTADAAADGRGPGADGSSTGDSSAGVSTSYVYSSQPAAAGAEATLGLLNAQGAEGRAYIGPYIGAGLPTAGAELFLRPTPAVTFVYARESASRETPEAFVARLDAKGAQGLAFKGPLLFGVGTELVFVKNAARGATYAYATSPGADDEAASLKALNEMGAKGFSYLTDYVTDDSQPLARVRLFQKVTSASPAATYAYAFDAAPADKAAAETALAERGRTGGVWRGALAFGAGSRFLFETASTTTGQVKYAIEDDPGGDASAVVAKLNPRGAEGYYYLGPYLFGGKSSLVLMQGPPTALALTGTVLP